MPKYVVNHKNLEQCAIVCKSLATTWKGLKYNVRKDQYVVRNVVGVVVVSSSNIESLRVAKSCLGMNRRTIKRDFEKRKLFGSQEIGHKWVKGNRTQKKDALTKYVKNSVVKW
jgi:hypothetical protein